MANEKSGRQIQCSILAACEEQCGSNDRTDSRNGEHRRFSARILLSIRGCQLALLFRKRSVTGTALKFERTICVVVPARTETAASHFSRVSPTSASILRDVIQYVPGAILLNSPRPFTSVLRLADCVTRLRQVQSHCIHASGARGFHVRPPRSRVNGFQVGIHHLFAVWIGGHKFSDLEVVFVNPTLIFLRILRAVALFVFPCREIGARARTVFVEVGFPKLGNIDDLICRQFLAEIVSGDRRGLILLHPRFQFLRNRQAVNEAIEVEFWHGSICLALNVREALAQQVEWQSSHRFGHARGWRDARRERNRSRRSRGRQACEQTARYHQQNCPIRESHVAHRSRMRLCETLGFSSLCAVVTAWKRK